VKVKKTSHYNVLFDDDEVKEALVYWLSVGRSSTPGIKVACMMNNSPCKISRDEEGLISISFEWEEEDEEDKL